MDKQEEFDVEYGCLEQFGLAQPTLVDENKSRVLCPCGNVAETFVAGRESILFRCNKCMELVPVNLPYDPKEER